MRKRSADVVVAGAGVIGCSIALELGRSGYKVIVVDPLTGPGEGSTSYSSSVLRLFYSVPESIKCAWESYQMWNNWRDHLQLPSSSSLDLPTLRRHDGIMLKSPRSNAFINEFCAAAETIPGGIRIDHLDLEETAKRVNLAGFDITHGYSPKRITDENFDVPEKEGISGCVSVPDTAYISDPRLATANIMSAAANTGRVEFQFSRKVVSSQKEQRRIVSVALDNGETIATNTLVNACGPYSSLFNNLMFDGEEFVDDSIVKTRPLRAEVAVVDAPPGIDLEKNGIIVPEFDVGVYVRPEFGNRLLIGSLDPPCDPHVYEAEPWKQDTAFTDMWDHNVYRAALRMPAVSVPAGRQARGIVSMYDSTADWTPVLDKSSIEGYFLAIGTNGNCFKHGPIFGKLMRQMIEQQQKSSGGSQREDDGIFELEITKSKLDMKQFSRNRALHNSAGTASVCG